MGLAFSIHCHGETDWQGQPEKHDFSIHFLGLADREVSLFGIRIPAVVGL